MQLKIVPDCSPLAVMTKLEVAEGAYRAADLVNVTQQSVQLFPHLTRTD